MKGRKKEYATGIRDKEGKIEEDPDKIKEIYKGYFEELLKDRKPEDSEEEEVDKLKEMCVKTMEKAASNIQIKEIKEEYQTMKNQLKKKKAPDKEGWHYEWIKWAGEDLDESIKIGINQVLKAKKPPQEWKTMKIRPT